MRFLFVALIFCGISGWAQDISSGNQLSQASHKTSEEFLLAKYIVEGKRKYSVGDYRGAISCFDKALKINPDTSAYRYRGLSNLVLRDYYASIEDFSKLIRLTPKDAEAYFVRAVARSKIGDYAGEIQDYNEVIALDPENGDAYFNRGSAKLQLDYYVSAIADFNKAIALKPDHGAAYANRGQARIAFGDKEGGCKDLFKAGDLGFSEAFPIIIKNCY